MDGCSQALHVPAVHTCMAHELQSGAGHLALPTGPGPRLGVQTEMRSKVNYEDSLLKRPLKSIHMLWILSEHDKCVVHVGQLALGWRGT